MKQRIFHILFIAFITMAIPFHSSGSEKVIDFNFPQDVSKEALTDLNKALKSGDGEMTVDALVRYGIAQSSISQDNMADIIERLESTIAQEKRPHFKALLYHLESLIYKDYRDNYARWRDRNNPVGEEPVDVSEWDREQFNKKISELIEKSLVEPEALKAVAVTSLPGIIKCNELGATYIPTLYEFLLMKGKRMLENTGTDETDFIERIKADWMETTKGNVPAHIYALIQTMDNIPIETYQQYQDNEHCALMRDFLSFENEKAQYKMLKEYVERFPNSIYTAEVKNEITSLERKEVRLSYPTVCSSHDDITVRAYVRNAKSFTIEVYSIPEYMLNSRLKKSEMKLISSHPVTVQGNVPFNVDNVVTTLPPLPYGAYAICPVIDGNKDNNPYLSNSNILRVTDIATFTIARIDHKDLIAAVDIETGKPLTGVTLRAEREKTVRITDDDGTAPIHRTSPQGDIILIQNDRFTASKYEDRYAMPISYNIMDNRAYTTKSAQIYTDLGVYRPGETIQWAAIVFRATSDKGNQPIGWLTAEATFMDNNNQPIDTLTLKTDEFGRIEGSFVVPKDRMNGTFMIQLTEKGKSSNRPLGRFYVNVSEYKTPTFEVTFPSPRRSYVAGQPVKITGKAMSYSGLPVQNTEVRLSLIKKGWSWWWWNMQNTNGEHLMDTTIMTDAQGNFTIEFPAELFEENKDYKAGKRCWARYNYLVAATITTDAGETHEESTAFIVGTRRGIELGSINNDIYLNDKPIKLPLKYNTTDENNPNTYCTWEVTPVDGKTPVLTGNLNTDDPTVDLTSLPSGQYVIKLHILDAEEGEQDVDAERTITLYRKDDKTPPVNNCPLWLTPLEQSVDKKNVGHITIGVSTHKAYIYYVARTSEEVIAQGWLTYDKGMHDFTVQLPKEAGKNVVVHFISHYDTKLWQESVTLENPYKAEAVNITATSFRDKLVPGNMEHWTFSLTDQNGKPHQGAMLLDMFDKAIASIKGNKWGFTNWAPHYGTANIRTTFLGYTQSSADYWIGKMVNGPDMRQPQLPILYTYNQDFFGYANGRYRSLSRSMKGGNDELSVSEVAFGNDAALEEVVVTGYAKTDKRLFTGSTQTTDAVKSAVFVEEAEAQAPVNERNFDKVTLRESDVKTALWRPMLTSDNKGKISVEFEAPNFNTTWITQAVAWDKRMIGSTWMAEVLTQKPLMVRANMPRFLRQGDKAALAATVQNATDEAASCEAIIELFDPRSGDIYTTRNFKLKLDPKGSQAVNIDWTVPDTVSMVGFRIKAANNRFGDGEQVMVPVLTTVSPVIETEPFYIEAGQNHHEVTLPKFPQDDRVTLEYCDNPVWYCVLALPTIFSDSYCTATHAAHSLFALLVAQGVAKEQPQIKEAIDYWKQHDEDSTLVSMLQKNQDLKIGTLLASPWIREADKQTLRMSKLHELFDEAITKKEYEKIITKLQSLQRSDGGFTWFLHPNCKSSVWTTGAVLEQLGDIKHLGYMPEDSRLTTMINRALKYYDSENVNMLNEYKKYSQAPYGLFTQFAYVRSLYPEVKPTGASADLLKNTLKHMDKNWSTGITLKQKAYYALTLNRNGYQKTARDIVESIRQYAIVKPSLGMYWDNLQKGYGWWELDKVAYTSTILRTMNEVDPRQNELDQIRKWMLLMKQSNDWGSYSLASDAVYSILSTGSQWLDRGTTPVITVAGQSVNLDKMAQWLGYFRTSLPASTAGSVVIDRTSKGPAWGAVYNQFKAPMTQIEEKAIEEISISKEYYVYAQDGSLHKTDDFKVGDKVKVRVIIKLNKDMDYVTMTDERAACFEPVDQLSGSRSEDQTWFYLETKDSQTNAFFNSLSKGTHIIGYDVWVTNPGEFTSGIATIQCQYAPQLSAHSAGRTISVKGQ